MKINTELPVTPAAILKLIQSLGKETLQDTAIGCRLSGVDPVNCAPVLLGQFPNTDTGLMANTLTMAWAGIINATSLTKALKACNYNDSDITAAVQAAINLNYLQNVTYSDGNFLNKAQALYQGDLTKLYIPEAVDYLIISSLPNDYTPTPGSVIGDLNNLGISVAALAENKAADYRPDYNCWVSQDISNQTIRRIICFEPTQSGNGAAKQVPGIFSSLQQFGGTVTTKDIIVATSMVSTGSNGADPSDILTALFNGGKSLLSSTFSLMSFEIVNYNTDWDTKLNDLFTQLKQA